MTEHTTASGAPRIELRVRHAVQPPVQDRVLEIRNQLEELEDTDEIAGLDVEVWGSRIDLDQSTELTDSLETYIAFAEWAAAQDYELGPAFRLHRSRSMVSSTDYPVVTVPLVTLAVYKNNELQAVYPHSTGDVVRTVDDALAELSPAPKQENRTLVQ